MEASRGMLARSWPLRFSLVDSSFPPELASLIHMKTVFIAALVLTLVVYIAAAESTPECSYALKGKIKDDPTLDSLILNARRQYVLPSSSLLILSSNFYHHFINTHLLLCNTLTWLNSDSWHLVLILSSAAISPF